MFFTHSGVIERDLLVLKSTHLQSFQSGSLETGKEGMFSRGARRHSAEKLFICCAKRSVFTQREMMKRHYARPYRACWLCGPLQAATGWLRELHGAAAACLPAGALPVWRRLQGPPMETLRFLLAENLFN